MDNVALFIGYVVLYTACGCVIAIALGLIGLAMCCTWIEFSEKFRDICKAESMIFEYRKNRDKFMEWRRMMNNAADKEN